LFSYDLYKRWAPGTSEDKLVMIGRIVTFVAMVLAVVWSPLCGRFLTVFQGINAAISYLAPPITVVFVAGVFWRRASSKASFITLITGSAVGFVVFLLDFSKLLAGFKTAHPSFGFLNFMVISFLLACLCGAVMIVLSLAFPDEPTEQKMALVWKSPLEPLREKGWPGLGNYKFLSALLALTMIVLYVVFR